MSYPQLRFYDTNDQLDLYIEGSYGWNQDFKDDLIAYIKTRAAELPSVGTITAYESVITGTVL